MKVNGINKNNQQSIEMNGHLYESMDIIDENWWTPKKIKESPKESDGNQWTAV